MGEVRRRLVDQDCDQLDQLAVEPLQPPEGSPLDAAALCRSFDAVFRTLDVELDTEPHAVHLNRVLFQYPA